MKDISKDIHNLNTFNGLSIYTCSVVNPLQNSWTPLNTTWTSYFVSISVCWECKQRERGSTQSGLIISSSVKLVLYHALATIRFKVICFHWSDVLTSTLDQTLCLTLNLITNLNPTLILYLSTQKVWSNCNQSIVHAYKSEHCKWMHLFSAYQRLWYYLHIFKKQKVCRGQLHESDFLSMLTLSTCICHVMSFLFCFLLPSYGFSLFLPWS